MRIKVLILFGFILSTSIMLAAGGALLTIFQSNTNAVKANHGAQKIGAAVFDLSMLTSDFLLYREDRSRQQWQQKYDSMKELIAGDDTTILQVDPQYNTLQANHRRIGRTFDKLVEVSNLKLKTVDPLNLIALEKRLTADLQILSHGMGTAASNIVFSSVAMLRNNAKRAGNFIVILGVTVFVIAVSPWFIFARRISQPLIKLQEGIERFGGGNLDSRIGGLEVKEINTVAESFDEMAEKLQKSTVSKNALMKEVEERKRAEKKLKELNLSLSHNSIELELANQELDAFAYSVSHDLRAPLRGVDGFSRLLVDEYSESLDEKAIGHLNRIRAGVQRMGDLIDSLLVLSRSSRAEMRPRELNLSEMVESTAKELQDSDPDRKVTFEIAKDVKARGDKELIQQVLENLIGNAWKYTAKTAEPVISFEEKCENGQQVISVRDNGAGFNMAYADKLFAPFQRLHSSKDFEGSGIGLATVKRIINRHGGRIWADSKVGKGTVFSLTIK